jgi:hypothetical protein
MSLGEHDKAAVIDSIREGLNRAEANWLLVGEELVKVAQDSVVIESAAERSRIPGYPWVEDGKPKVDTFAAVVVDMRKSSDRLKTRLSCSDINGIQRVYYETSALLPAVATVASLYGGVVTEYLGDGALVLNRLEEEDYCDIKKVYRSAENYVGDMRCLLNNELKKRYNLPSISIGVGMSVGRAMVTLVGADGNLQAKAIGECVWEASKLSADFNKVCVSRNVKTVWPSSSFGMTKFEKMNSRHHRGVDGYYVSK